MADIAALIPALAALIGPAHLGTDPNDCVLMGQDIFHRGDPVAVVARPGTAADVAAIVKATAAYGAHIVVRGGGMSYSGGYLSPDPANAVALDMRRMNRIIEIAADDMYAVVEPGCTWEDLHAALDPLGLRTPYWGTLSGRIATVGGSISQNAIFWGAGRAGSAADSVIGLEIVTGTGAIIRTGTLGVADAAPFFRHFGPDLTGLFTGDAGALGVKTAVVLRLMRRPDHAEGLSFLVPDITALCRLMGEAARGNLVTQQMALDDGLKNARMTGASWRDDLRMLAGVARNAGIAAAARMVLAGRSVLDGMPYSAHMFVEADGRGELARIKARLRRLADAVGAREIPPVVADLMQSRPFPDLRAIAGPKGERWVPVHGIVPLSRGEAAYAAIARVLADHATAMAQGGITTACLFTTIGNHALVMEPMLFWPDALDRVHREALGADRVARLAAYPHSPAARATVQVVRRALTEAMDALGAVHIQLGRFYPYARRLDPGASALLASIRGHIDPGGTINPQALTG